VWFFVGQRPFIHCVAEFLEAWWPEPFTSASNTLNRGWPKNWHNCLYALTLPNINWISKLFHCQNQEKICNNTITKVPTTPQLCCYTTLWNFKCFKSNNRKKTTSVTTHFKSASSSSKADILNIWCKNFRMWQLLWTITETINTLFPVVNFLKCVVTEVVLFSIAAFKTLDILQGSVATHLRCAGIFIANFLLILIVK